MKKRWYIAAELVFFLIALIFAYVFVNQFSVMFLSKDRHVYFCDQVIFEVVGKAWANGIPAYTYYFDHKGPIVFLFFCLGYLVDGTRHGLMLFYVFWTALSMYLLHKTLFQMNWFVSYKANMLVSSTVGILGIFLLWLMNVQSGIVVAQIIMPFLLICVWILCHWYQNGFTTGWYLHLIYGVCCMLIILARANDAIFVFIAYVMLFFMNLSRQSERNLFMTILGGLLPFAWFYAYFCRYDAADTFMYCTFWSNFKYVGISANSDESCTYAFVYALIAIFIVFTIVIYKRKQHAFAYLLAFACHLGFYATTTRFLQYLVSFLAEIVVLLYIASYDIKLQRIRQKQIFGMIMALFLSYFAVATFVVTLYVGWYHAVYEKIYDFDDMICEDLISSGKSYMVFNDPHLLGTILDAGYELPACRYALFQDWHVYCHILSKEDMKAGIDESKPDVIILVNESPDADYYFEDYDLVAVKDPADITGFSYNEEFTYYFYERCD